MADYRDDEDFLMDDAGGAEYDDRPARGRRRLESHRGTLILVLGILGFVVCPITSPFAWMMGNEDLRKIRAGRMDPEGEGLTQAGRIMGIIGTVLMALGVVFFLVAIVLGVAAGGASSGEYGG